MKLTIKNLTIRAKSQIIVKDFSLTIAAGELHVLMGPNGSGKSSLAKALMGHPDYQVTSGTVQIGKTNLLSLPPHRRAQAGLFLGFQQPSLLPGVSLFQLVKTTTANGTSALKLYNTLKTQAKYLHLKPNLLRQSLNQNFSGGEQKKAEILQMAHLRPKFALLDEPDTGLDVDALKLVASQIKNQQKQGAGILLITHYHRILKFLTPEAVHLLLSGKKVKSGNIHLAQRIENEGYTQITN